ncbi:MAG TPA: hypothetical protein VM513_32060 [Kofleriaceae bacterium]|nr:hypothetical protein [Kofleriaceae bacterium]
MRKSPTLPPSPAPTGPAPGQPGVMVSPGAQQARPGSHTELDGRPGTFDESTTIDPHDQDTTLEPQGERQSLMDAISPGPAALRREAARPDAHDPQGPARRASDQARPNTPPTPPLRSQTPAATPPLRANTPSTPPPLRGRTPTSPPPRPRTPSSSTGAVSSPMKPEESVSSAWSVPDVAAAIPPSSGAPSSLPAWARSGGVAAPVAGTASGGTGAAPRPKKVSTPPPLPSKPVIPPSAFGDDFNTVAEAQPIDVVSLKPSTRAGDTPPPTRIQAVDRPFTPPKVHPVPEVPEPGLVNAAKYALHFGRARFQRRGAIKLLHTEIKQDTEALDQVLGALGRVARQRRVDGRVFLAENQAINAAEERIAALTKEHADVELRKAEENSKFVDIERERNAKLSEAEKLVEEGTSELSHLEGQRRALREQRKDLERRQKAYLKSAEDNERQAGNAQMGETRADLRRSAEQFRRDAAAMEPERQEVDRRLAALERPISEATAKLDAAKAELDAAKRSLGDAREGHNHRLAELDAEQKRKARDIGNTEGEIARRLVTLGTLVNLNRIEDPAFTELYERIDRLRGAITARTTEIEKLTAEREAYDRGTLVRGVATIGGAIVLFITLIVILRAVV